MDGANSPVGHWYEHAGDLVALFNPSTIVLIGQAVGVVYYAALRSLALEHEMELSKTLEDAISLDSQQVLLIPIFSSMGLLLSFYFFSTISFVLAVFSIVACGFSLVFVMAPLVNWVSKLALPEALRQRIYFHLYDTPVTSAVAVTILASVVTTVSWLVTAHWTLNNVLGMALCITYVSYIRLPNVKVCTLLLCCLFVYDIFWVFLSSRIFGANVMVAVATKQAENPLRAVANTFHLPVSDLVSGKLDLPVKLMVPRFLFETPPGQGSDFLMLGLGDMALPGMLLALMMSFDDNRRQRRQDNASSLMQAGSDTLRQVAGQEQFSMRRVPYVRVALIGYLMGLVLSMTAGILSQAPQPALLYLVPCTLIPVTAKAWLHHELVELWNGPRRLATAHAEKNIV